MGFKGSKLYRHVFVMLCGWPRIQMLLKADNKDSDQHVRMRKLIWIFAVQTGNIVINSVPRLHLLDFYGKAVSLLLWMWIKFWTAYGDISNDVHSPSLYLQFIITCNYEYGFTITFVGPIYTITMWNQVYRRTSIARTPMARLPWLIRTHFWLPSKFFR